MRIILTLTTLLFTAAAAHASDWVIKSSPHDVNVTADRLEAAIDASPAKLAARIDHQKAATEAGLEMSPATVLIFGNPVVGTPLMQANPMVALDLPARVLIWQDEKGTQVGYLEPEKLAERYDIDASDAIEKLAGAMDMLTEKAIAAD